MNDREKKLALGFAAVILFWFGKPIFESWFIEPVDQRKLRVESLAKQVGDLEFKEVQLLAAQSNLFNATRQGLPANGLSSQRIYQEWVTDLATMFGFRDLEIKPGLRSSRGKVYTAVSVTIDAQATYDELCQFLKAFESADVLHRVSSLHLETDIHRGNPLIEVSLTAEALCMPKTPPRETVFPRFNLKQAVTAEAKSLTPVATEGFPKENPFLVRVGGEMLEATPLKTGTWSLKRGLFGTTPLAHAPNAEVELFRVRPNHPVVSDEEIEQIVAENFFVKPSPPIEYEPKFTPIGNKSVIRGETLKVTLGETGFPPETPTRSYRMDGEIPPGLQLDETTGELTWTPDDVPPATDYKVVFDLLVEGEKEPRFSQEVTLTLKEPNIPPTLSPVATQTVIAGSPFKLKLDAEDAETSAQDLTFSTVGELPEGATFDSRSGTFEWTPPQTMLPQELEFVAKVTDRGDPAKSAETNVKLSVIEDLTRDTFLTGVISRDGTPQAMLYNRAENVTTVLLTGYPFEVAGVKGVVTGIRRDQVEWKSGDEFWRLELGENLYTRESIAAPKSPTVPAEVDPTPLVAPREPVSE